VAQRKGTATTTPTISFEKPIGCTIWGPQSCNPEMQKISPVATKSEWWQHAIAAFSLPSSQEASAGPSGIV